MSDPGSPAPTRTGVIHDIGYQRYSGPRLGRGYAVRSLYVHSLRAAFGLGRGAKAKMAPFTLLGIFCITALIVTIVESQLGIEALSPLQFPVALALPTILFLAVVAPELVSRDLRNHTLPLYFSRPITRTDYALAKYAAFVSAYLILLASPLLIMYLGGAFATDDGVTGVLTETGDFLLGLVNAVMYAVLLPALSLLVASLSGRRILAAGMVVALFLVTTPVTGVLTVTASGEAGQQLAGLADPVSLLSGVSTWLFGAEWDNEVGIGPYGPLYAVVGLLLATGSIALLVQRYRRVTT